MTVSASDNLIDNFPDRPLPPFIWLHVTGTAGKDDFGVGKDHRFVISERALEIIRPFGLKYAEIEPYYP